MAIVKKLDWSEHSPPDFGCGYDHIRVETPLGRFLLIWPGWEEYPSYKFIETPWGELHDAGLLGFRRKEDAIEWAETELSKRVREMLESSELEHKD